VTVFNIADVQNFTVIYFNNALPDTCTSAPVPTQCH